MNFKKFKIELQVLLTSQGAVKDQILDFPYGGSDLF